MRDCAVYTDKIKYEEVVCLIENSGAFGLKQGFREGERGNNHQSGRGNENPIKFEGKNFKTAREYFVELTRRV